MRSLHPVKSRTAGLHSSRGDRTVRPPIAEGPEQGRSLVFLLSAACVNERQRFCENEGAKTICHGGIHLALTGAWRSELKPRP